MPAVFAAIPAIIAAVGGGVSAVEGIKALTSGGPSAPTVTPQQQAQQDAQRRAILASNVQHGLGNLQEAGGGGLAPGYLASQIGQQSGTSDQMSALLDLIKQYGGGGGGAGGFGGGAGDTSLPSLSIPTQSTNTLNQGPGLADASIFA